MNIDWDAVNGFTVREARAPTFDPATIDAAVADAQALPPAKNNPNRVSVPWPVANPLPTVADLDMGDAPVEMVPLSDLQASNRALNRTRLIWHIQNPGQRMNVGPLTTNPMLIDWPGGSVIIDGQHFLGALFMLGCAEWPCWLLPPS